MGVLLKRIFFGLPFFVLASLIVFSFFQHPCSDDFAGNYLAKTMGYGEATRYYLSHENGRFSSVPVFIFFTQFRFLLDHYYTGLIFFLLITYPVLFFFIRYIVRTFYDMNRGTAWYHWLTAFSMLVLLVCMPEPSSFYSWLATDTTYLFSFLFIPFYLVKLQQLLTLPPAAGKAIHLATLGLIILVLAGANEVSLFFPFVFFMAVFAYRSLLLKQKPGVLYIVLLMHVLAIALVLWMPGNGRRSEGYIQKQFFLFSAAGALYQLSQLAFGIFSSPVFWLSVCLGLYGGRHLKEPVKNSLRNKRTSLAVELLMLFSAVFVFCFIIRLVGGVVLPPRTRNIIVCIMVPVLLVIAVANGHRLSSVSSFVPGKENRHHLFFIFGTLILVFNPFMYGLLQSAVDGPVHHELMNRRIALIKQAKANGTQKAFFHSYEEDFSALMVQKYGAKTAAFLRVEFPSPPKMLYFRDDVASSIMAPFYAEYYGIDTLQVNDHIHIRLGLMPASPSAGSAEEDKIRSNY